VLLVAAVCTTTATACASTAGSAAGGASKAPPPGASTSASPASPSPGASGGAAAPIAGASGSAGGGAIQPGGPKVPASPPASGGSGQGASGPVADSYQASGSTLTVYFTAGICDRYGLQTQESQTGRVLVRVVVTAGPTPGEMCPALAKQQSVSTTLTAPLGGRTVVDSSTGDRLPQHSTTMTPMPHITHGPVKK